MEKDKGKRRGDDGSGAKRKRGKEPENDDCVVPPEDEEVEEFFAILKRIQVAVRYFEKRDGGRRRAEKAKPWSPSFKREDFEEIQDLENTPAKQHAGLDLNSRPVRDDSEKTVESQLA